MRKETNASGHSSAALGAWQGCTGPEDLARVYKWTQTATAGTVMGVGEPRQGLPDRRAAAGIILQRCGLRWGFQSQAELGFVLPAHPRCCQTSHLLLLDEGRDEAPLVRWAIRHRVDHDLVGEEVNGRLWRHRPESSCPSWGNPALGASAAGVP